MLNRLIRLAAVWVASVGCALTAPALASGPTELMAQVTVDPQNPARLVVRYANLDGTRRGLILSDDAGKSWRLMCSDCIHQQAVAAGVVAPSGEVDSFKFELRRMHSVALGTGGATLVNTSLGLVAGDAQGCGFRAEPLFAEQDVTRLMDHPTLPGVTFALVGWEGPSQGMWRRSDDGRWARFGATESLRTDGARVVYKSAALAKNDSDVRVYQTVWRFEPEASAGHMALRVSDDGAETWRELPLASDPEELELLAVDPTQRERVVGVIRRSDNSLRDWSKELDTLMLSDDGGQHFRAYFDVAALSAVAFGPDGTLWISDAGATVGDETRAGLFRAAPGLAAAPVQLSTNPHQCVSYAAVNQTFYACQGIRAGRLDPQSGALEELVRLDSVRELATCQGVDTKAICQEQLCMNGYCLYTHYPQAPVCAAYDSMLCGPSSIRDASAAASLDAAVMPTDTAGRDASAGGSGSDAGSAEPDEAGVAADADPDPAAASEAPSCDCSVTARSASALGALGWCGMLAVLVARRRRPRS
jgi:hypothetical protein